MNTFEQIGMFADPFDITGEEMNHVLRYGSGFSGGKNRIRERLSREGSAKEDVEFLKKEYGTGSIWPAYIPDKDGKMDLGIDFDCANMRITRCRRWNYTVQISWVEAAKRIRQMIEAGTYGGGEER